MDVDPVNRPHPHVPRWNGGRLLAVYLLIVATIIVSGFYLNHIADRADRAEKQTVHNCELINIPITLINSVVDQLETSVSTSTVLPPATKQDRIEQYEKFRHALVSCPSQK